MLLLKDSLKVKMADVDEGIGSCNKAGMHIYDMNAPYKADTHVFHNFLCIVHMDDTDYRAELLRICHRKLNRLRMEKEIPEEAELRSAC